MSKFAKSRRRRTCHRQLSASRFSSSWSSTVKRRLSRRCSYWSSRDSKKGKRLRRLSMLIRGNRPILKNRNLKLQSSIKRNFRRKIEKGKKRPNFAIRLSKTRRNLKRSKHRRKSKSLLTSNRNWKQKRWWSMLTLTLMRTTRCLFRSSKCTWSQVAFSVSKSPRPSQASKCRRRNRWARSRKKKWTTKTGTSKRFSIATTVAEAKLHPL